MGVVCEFLNAIPSKINKNTRGVPGGGLRDLEAPWSFIEPKMISKVVKIRDCGVKFSTSFTWDALFSLLHVVLHNILWFLMLIFAFSVYAYQSFWSYQPTNCILKNGGSRPFPYFKKVRLKSPPREGLWSPPPWNNPWYVPEYFPVSSVDK